MSAPISVDIALRNIGRTLTNFQRLEKHLKALSTLQPISGTLSKIKNEFDKRIEKAATFTLGHAINMWLATLNESHTTTPQVEDLFDITMSTRMQFDMDSGSKNSHALQLLPERSDTDRKGFARP